MTEEDYEDLVEFLQAELRKIGEPEIADIRHYRETPIVRDSPLGSETMAEAARAHPRDILIEMLKAFERHLGVRDKQTYSDAIEIISSVVRGFRPDDVIVLDEGSPSASELVRLSDAPDLSKVREEIDDFISSLPQTRDGPARLQ